MEDIKVSIDRGMSCLIVNILNRGVKSIDLTNKVNEESVVGFSIKIVPEELANEVEELILGNPFGQENDLLISDMKSLKHLKITGEVVSFSSRYYTKAPNIEKLTINVEQIHELDTTDFRKLKEIEVVGVAKGYDVLEVNEEHMDINKFMQEGMTIITKEMFNSFSHLEYLKLPSTIRVIQYNAFNKLKSLNELELNSVPIMYEELGIRDGANVVCHNRFCSRYIQLNNTGKLNIIEDTNELINYDIMDKIKRQIVKSNMLGYRIEYGDFNREDDLCTMLLEFMDGDYIKETIRSHFELEFSRRKLLLLHEVALYQHGIGVCISFDKFMYVFSNDKNYLGVTNNYLVGVYMDNDEYYLVIEPIDKEIMFEYLNSVEEKDYLYNGTNYTNLCIPYRSIKLNKDKVYIDGDTLNIKNITEKDRIFKIEYKDGSVEEIRDI